MSAPAVGAKVRKVDDPGYFGSFIKADGNGCWLIEVADGERHWKLAEQWREMADPHDVVTITIPRWVAVTVAAWTAIETMPISTEIIRACRSTVEATR